VGAFYREILDRRLGIVLWVDFRTERGKVVNYSVVLLVVTNGGVETIRVYDAAHGYNEMHRYTDGGRKQPGAMFHSGSLGEGMRAAIKDVKRGHRGMIEGWGP
jgi:hypothetical protein